MTHQVKEIWAHSTENSSREEDLRRKAQIGYPMPCMEDSGAYFEKEDSFPS